MTQKLGFHFWQRQDISFFYRLPSVTLRPTQHPVRRFWVQSSQDLNLTTHLHFVAKLGMHEAISPLPSMPLSWCLVKHRTKCTFILSGRDCQPVFKLWCIWFKFWMTQHNHLGCDVLQFGRYIAVLLWNLLPSSSGYKETRATGSYKMFVPIYQTA